MKDMNLSMFYRLIVAGVVCLGVAVVLLFGQAHASESPLPSRNPLSFFVDFGEPVGMRITDTIHYQTDTEEGAREFAKLMPSGGHTVHLGADEKTDPEPYTVTLFHQLKCIDIIRAQYAKKASGEEPPSIVRHCMNYLRQTIICRQNMRIEPVKNVVGTAARGYDAVCRDWTKLYDEAERNYAEYVERDATAML